MNCSNLRVVLFSILLAALLSGTTLRSLISAEHPGITHTLLFKGQVSGTDEQVIVWDHAIRSRRGQYAASPPGRGHVPRYLRHRQLARGGETTGDPPRRRDASRLSRDRSHPLESQQDRAAALYRADRGRGRPEPLRAPAVGSCPRVCILT